MKTAEEWTSELFARNPSTAIVTELVRQLEIKRVRQIQADTLRHAANDAEKICDDLTAATLRHTANELDPQN